MNKTNKKTVVIIFNLILFYIFTLLILFYIFKMDYFSSKLKYIDSNVIGSRWIYHKTN